jgi:DNA-binding NtrC family response regulator
LEKKRIKVLIIENDPAAAALYRKILNMPGGISFEVKWADCLAQALECVNAELFDVILSDLSLADSTGLHTFIKVKERVGDTPVIVLTGSENAEFGVHALRAGATDYISKGRVDYHTLMHAITVAIERSHIEKDLRG